ncbi:hypothetical protein MPNT_160006 [Candidatus Methylacidithermus pantelleriae]|uniref:Uncharacterized protein n=1 Tax=Candidatus Methylacidithermus pantelleriae TaxID=2744239 RepID=A0A8J2BNM6_9BACT|nr:hypothetical protein MPNT_160006 [Candidatus Methylacidithermus pantelleriae]
MAQITAKKGVGNKTNRVDSVVIIHLGVHPRPSTLQHLTVRMVPSDRLARSPEARFSTFTLFCSFRPVNPDSAG